MPASQLRKDRLHCGVVFLVVWAGPCEMLVERNKVFYLCDIKQRLACAATANLVNAQQFGPPGSHSVTLRFRDARCSMVGKRQTPLAVDRINDDLIHRTCPQHVTDGFCFALAMAWSPFHVRPFDGRAPSSSQLCARGDSRA